MIEGNGGTQADIDKSGILEEARKVEIPIRFASLGKWHMCHRHNYEHFNL